MTENFENTWISSDHHFGHKNIIKYTPWSRGHLNSTEEMNEELIAKHNSLVGANDLTFFVGDFAFCSPKEAMEYMSRMNGKKILIMGNHDRKLWNSTEFQSMAKMAGLIGSDKYLTFEHKMPDGRKRSVVLFHFKIDGWDAKHHGSYHLHGHLHSAPDQLINSRRMDIGVDTNNLYPHSLDIVLDKLSVQPYKEDRPNHSSGN